MRTLSTLASATSDTVTALLHTGSIAVAVGAAATAYTQNLRTGLLVGAAALVLASTAFGFNLWRTYGPPARRQRLIFGRKRAAKASEV